MAADMDLVVLIDDSGAKLDPGNFVESMAVLLERETNFNVKPLPRARIPILKLELAPSSALPFGIACDIGIENRLAIENTRLLLTYATIDPARVRTLVLFLKVWSKRRRINSPYRGTLSSYGFTLMVLYFLVHVKQPPVLPNLQRIMPMRPLEEDEVMLEGRNVYFFDDVETLRREWSSVNFESVGELLVDFFRYFSHDFQFNNSVLSLRAGQLTKESKGWVNDIDVGGLNEMARDRNRLCIEDPFEISYNVARTVTKDGLYTIRGEFMRATRILTQRPDRAVLALAELCREREDELQRAPRSSSPAPRALSANRGNFSNSHAQGQWRSQSQTSYDRLGAGVHESRGLRSGEDLSEYSAQDLWLHSQGTSLGGVQTLNEDVDARGSRGRDTVARGLDTAGGSHRGSPSTRRSTSAYADGGGLTTTGTVSAPLSPQRLYAQLELGKGASVNQQQMWAGYDPRLHASAGMPLGVSGPSGLRSQSQQGTSRALSGLASRPLSSFATSTGILPTPAGAKGLHATTHLPAFSPFDADPVTPAPVSIHVESLHTGPSTAPLRQPSVHLTGSDVPAEFISPSTLLSPVPRVTTLPESRNGTPEVDYLVHSMRSVSVDTSGDPGSREKSGSDCPPAT
ncbi:hypothetical protein L198_04145 [Cryptococcus wingfieldii CBS 7118]|uniref:polynucleotide adenylyltransferase n=1 Tax=Cryptococcus wingfieldii CBS 7118 TaxID=1295528 RepID=A0A1E3J924_9TREE|nr:hypothetical protein L198_04145 [Cryptococcus wingfieldii CBS 7118]ODN96431.1 hypothetical protein L198_04145 [Cryptococcus wingfieldii CBS 7118]